MGKHPHNRFPGLRIVASTDKKLRQGPATLRWWGPRPTRRLALNRAANPPESSHEIRMMVMPTLSRNLLFVAIAWMWNFLRGYFVTPGERQRGAAVLSFRRPAAWTPGFFRAQAQESFASKKASGIVRWNSDCKIAPQEGGRG
jgi:hypothetical protein